MKQILFLIQSNLMKIYVILYVMFALHTNRYSQIFNEIMQ